MSPPTSSTASATVLLDIYFKHDCLVVQRVSHSMRGCTAHTQCFRPFAVKFDVVDLLEEAEFNGKLDEIASHQLLN